MEQSYLNKLVDKIYCISEYNSKRRLKASKYINEINLKVKFIDAIMLKNNPKKGCFLSHIKTWRKAYNKNYKRVLILEDDFYFIRELYDKEINDITYLFSNKNWKILFLGYLPYKMKKTRLNSVVKCNSLGSHCYIINVKEFKKFLNIKINNISSLGAVDTHLLLLDKCYAIYPMVCYQDFSLGSYLGTSSNVNLHKYELLAYNNIKIRNTSFSFIANYIHNKVIDFNTIAIIVIIIMITIIKIC